MIELTISTRCTACGACIVTCPEQALAPAPKRPGVVIERCTACFACVEVCPVDAIEVESFRILRGRVDVGGLPAGDRAVVERVIHAGADAEYADTMVVSPGAVAAGIDALRAGAPVVADVEMTRHGITGVDARCYLTDVAPAPDGVTTRSALAVRLAAERHPTGAVVVIGCAPTALTEALRLITTGRFAPALVIGLPVGFVGAADAKAALAGSAVPHITNRGEKGGSAVAAAAFNAIRRLTGAS